MLSFPPFLLEPLRLPLALGPGDPGVTLGFRCRPGFAPSIPHPLHTELGCTCSPSAPPSSMQTSGPTLQRIAPLMAHSPGNLPCTWYSAYDRATAGEHLTPSLPPSPQTVKIWDMEAAGAYPLGPYQEGTPPPASLPPLETLSHPSAPLLLAFLNPHLLLSATPLCAYLWCLADLAPGTPSAPPGGQASRISGAPGAARHSAAQGQAGAQRGAAGTARLVRRIAGVSPGDAGTLRITCGTAWDMQFVAGMSEWKLLGRTGITVRHREGVHVI